MVCTLSQHRFLACHSRESQIMTKIICDWSLIFIWASINSPQTLKVNQLNSSLVFFLQWDLKQSSEKSPVWGPYLIWFYEYILFICLYIRNSLDLLHPTPLRNAGGEAAVSVRTVSQLPASQYDAQSGPAFLPAGDVTPPPAPVVWSRVQPPFGPAPSLADPVLGLPCPLSMFRHHCNNHTADISIVSCFSVSCFYYHSRLLVYTLAVAF